MKSVSIIVTCEEEEQQQLRRLLPDLLTLQYGGEYEVIVVDKKHDKDLAEWLEEMDAQHPHLSHTYCPASAKGLDLHKLALTLGAKAANHEWLAILSPDAQPASEDWLKKLLALCNDETEIVVGLINPGRHWNRFTSYLFRRRFSIYRPTTSIILCRRTTLLQGKPIKPTKRQIIKP